MATLIPSQPALKEQNKPSSPKPERDKSPLPGVLGIPMEKPASFVMGQECIMVQANHRNNQVISLPPLVNFL